MKREDLTVIGLLVDFVLYTASKVNSHKPSFPRKRESRNDAGFRVKPGMTSNVDVCK